MSAVFARIFLRYFAGFLVAYGFLGAEAGATFGADPDLIQILGVAIAAAVEGFYAVAKKVGWTT